MSLNLKPLGERLIVEPVEQEETTSGGIVLPETSKEQPQKGKVLAVGPGAREERGSRVQMDVAADDEVLVAKYSGTEVKIEGKKLLIKNPSREQP